MNESDAVESVGVSAPDAAITSLQQLRMAYSKLRVHVILSRLTDGRSQLKQHHSVPTDGASGFRTASRSLVLLAAQSQAPDSRTASLLADEEIHVFCEALIASDGRSDP